MCIKLGDSIIEFSDQFRFYITTSLRNPHYLPETAVKVTLLNFMITPDGLSDQLLGVVVAEERPDLESQRQELVVTSADNKKRLKEIEDRILHTMSSSEGNILDDAGAIEVLSEAKIVSDEISEKQKSRTRRRWRLTRREGYKPCGAYNAVLFFTIRDLANIDPMYQYSLSWFIGLFVRSIHGSEKQTENLASRLDVINDHFTYSLYQNVCRSLFEKDKLLFSFLLDCRIMGSVDDLPPEEFSFSSPAASAPRRRTSPPAGEEWISPKMWRETCRLASTSGAFASLPEDMVRDIAPWRAVYDSSQPHREVLPGKYGEDKALSAFQLLLLMRCLRPDKVTPAVNDFVERTMGRRFVEPPPFDLPVVRRVELRDAAAVRAVAPDPTSALLKFARTWRRRTPSPSPWAKGKARHAGHRRGDGRRQQLLQLPPGAQLMPSLEKICEGITVDSADENFRLWPTSCPPAFPVTILQNGIKSNEPPRGLRANMRRSFQLEPSPTRLFESCYKPETLKKLYRFGVVTASCRNADRSGRSGGTSVRLRRRRLAHQRPPAAHVRQRQQEDALPGVKTPPAAQLRRARDG